MTEKDGLEKLLTEHTRRLQKLNEQQARYGIATQPHILIEIEDIKAKIVELQSLLDPLKEVSRRNPYRGLMAFREADEPFFFGRETFTAQLLGYAQQKPFVAVLGPSGSGKSSIIFAGLLPKLARSGQWCFAPFRPGKEPFLGLAGALVPLYEIGLSKTEQLGVTRDLSTNLQAGRYPLADVLRLIQQAHPEHQSLIIIDQFEELYTLCRDSAIRELFLDMLLHTLDSASESSVHLVLTMRADFLGDALLYPPFGAVLQDTIVLLSSMDREALRIAIAKPAEQQHAHFESGLVERILNDVTDAPGSLPLLEFALTALWEQQAQYELTHRAYEAGGGVEGALSQYADVVMANLDEAKQAEAQRIFVQLVRPGEGTPDTRRIAYRHELDETSWQLVQWLASERLVVTDSDPVGQETVEVAHEALIRDWKQLKEWMAQHRVFRAWQERLRMSTHQWQDANRQDDGILLRGKLLADAEYWLTKREQDLSQAEREFIQASKSLQEGERRRKQLDKRFRRIAMALSIVLSLLIVSFIGRSWWTLRCPYYSNYCPSIRLFGLNIFNVKLAEANLSGANFAGVNLTGANFLKADLRATNLAAANLREADLAEANLQGANLSEADLTTTDFSGANLQGAILRKAKITDKGTRIAPKDRLIWEIVTTGAAGRDLSRANLYGANLSGANLYGANLQGADLSGANLYGANLQGADLRKADLRKADLRKADLREADLQGANLQKATVDSTTRIASKDWLIWEIVTMGAAGRDLSGANLQGANLQGANLSGANLQVADLRKANLSGANLQGANLQGADLSETALQVADIRKANLQGAALQGATLAQAYLNDTDLRKANLYEANLYEANLYEANLSGANLQGANLSGANLIKVSYSAETIWPLGFEPVKLGAVKIP